MKNFNLFLLTMGLLICCSLGYYQFGVSFGVVGPFSSRAFKCLSQTVPGWNQFQFIRAYRNSQSGSGPGVDPNGLTTMTNCWNSRTYLHNKADVYVELCRGLNATDQINSVKDQVITPFLLGQYISRSRRWFMLKVQPSSNPDCSWSKYSKSSNCDFLFEAQRAIQNIPWAAVIFSTATSWKQIFGSSCDNFGTYSAPLIYANYDSNSQLSSTRSYDDFVSFGGWRRDQVVGKLVGGAVRVPLTCPDIVPTSVLVDEYWQCYGC